MILLILFLVLVLLGFYVALYIVRLKQRYAALNEIRDQRAMNYFKISYLHHQIEKIWLYYRGLKQRYPRIYIYWHTVYPVVNILHHDNPEAVLSSMKHISKNKIYDALQPWLGTGLLTSTGSKWQHCRKMLTSAFHFSILREFIDVFNENSSILIKILEMECQRYVPFVRKIWLYYRGLKQQYPRIYKYWHSVYPVVNILHHEDAEVVLSSMKYISKSKIYDALQPWLGTGLLTSTGSKWQHRRKILTSAFHFSILREFIDVFNENSTILVKILEMECENRFTNVVPIVTQSTLRTICETAMGIELSGNTENINNYTNAIYRKQQFHTPSKTTKKRMALLDILISEQSLEKNIDDNGIREEVDTFMFEGHDTTTSCICFSLLAIANNFGVQTKIVEELKSIFKNPEQGSTFEDLQNMTYLDKVLKECLRLYPSVPFISRVADEDIKLGSGYTIPEGTIIQFHLYDLHRNPEIFPDPEKFDPERFSPENSKYRHPFAYVPFSAGPRNCIGQKFALLEVKTIISSILRKFCLYPIDTPADIKIGVHLILKSVNGIKIKFAKRTYSF